MSARLLLIAAVPLAALASQAAGACSWSYAEGYSPEEIKERTDVVRVPGSFTFEEFRGTPAGTNDDGEQLYTDALILGRIERGTAEWLTVINAPSQFEIDCAMPVRGPLADAQGTFWLERDRALRRWRIVWWEGEYAPPAEPAQKDAQPVPST